MRSKRVFIFIMTVVFAIGLLIIYAAGKANQGKNASEAFIQNSVKAPGEISVSAKNNTDFINAISTPGVNVEEIPESSRPILGVETAVAGFIGVTERGPLEPQLITNFSQFKDVYGDFYADSYLAYSAKGFLKMRAKSFI
jgi:hypothetical protein